MGPQLDLVPGESRHLGDIAAEHVQIEHQRRRVQRTPRALLADQVTVKSLASLMIDLSVLRVAHDHGLAGRAAVDAGGPA